MHAAVALQQLDLFGMDPEPLSQMLEKPKKKIVEMVNAVIHEPRKEEPEAMEGEVLLKKEKEVRWYQMEGVAGVEKALKDGHRRICLIMPTGAGKTHASRLVFESPVVREICGVPEGKPLRVLFVAHIHRLLEQAKREYEGDTVQLITQSAYSEVPESVIDEGWDMVCIDEAHHEAMHTYQDQLEIIAGTPIIGLTATADRDDGKLIKFSAMVEPISRVQAVREGYLAPSVIRTVIDESGDDKREILTDLLTRFAHRMGQTLIFVMTHVEVMHVANVLEKLGYSVVALIGQTGAEATAILDRFSQKEVQFVVNCARINEGIDVLGCTDVVLGRQYGSKRMLNQTIGRAARPDCSCNIWELVDPLETQYTAKTIIEEVKEQSLIYYDHQKKVWVEQDFNL